MYPLFLIGMWCPYLVEYSYHDINQTLLSYFRFECRFVNLIKTHLLCEISIISNTVEEKVFLRLISLN